MSALEPAVCAPTVEDGSEYSGMDPRIDILSKGLQPPNDCGTNTSRQPGNPVWYVMPPGYFVPHAHGSIGGCNGFEGAERVALEIRSNFLQAVPIPKMVLLLGDLSKNLMGGNAESPEMPNVVNQRFAIVTAVPC